MDQKEERKSFRHWATYAGESHFSPWLRYLRKARKQECLLSFAARVRIGIFGLAVQVEHQSVEKALRYVTQTLVMAVFEDPRKTQGSDDLDLPFQHLLLGYRQEDPAPQPQLALPMNTVEEAGGYFRAPASWHSTLRRRHH
jgi:hypothetical protein